MSWLGAKLAWLRGVIGIAVAGLAHDRTRTILATFGIAIAVLATTALGGVGYGVVETGQEKFDAAERDLWVTGGPMQFAPGTVGGVNNPIVGAHELADGLERHEAVKTAVPMSFQTVYVSTDGEEFETIVGVGAPARGGSVRVTEGQQFQQQDVHYADGDYDGPMTHSVIIDERTAALFNVSVGDSLYIGGTIADARANEFDIVGISPTFSQFLGAPTTVVHLSELQEITGTTGADSASIITISLKEGADAAAVRDDLQAQYPQYEIRTNEEQLRATVERQAVVLAAGGSLVVLALVAGISLTVNLLLGLVFQQRRELAALKALGSSTSTLVGVVTVQALLLGVVGGLLGLALTYPLVAGLNVVAELLVGFEDVVRLPDVLLAGGFAIAVVMSVVGAVAAGWRVSRLSPKAELA